MTSKSKKSKIDITEYVKRVLKENNWKADDVSENAARKGFKIERSYVTRIKNGDKKNLTIDSLTALAHGLKRPVREVFLVAAGELDEDSPEFTIGLFHQMYDAFETLPDDVKKIYEQMLSDMSRAMERIGLEEQRSSRKTG